MSNRRQSLRRARVCATFAPLPKQEENAALYIFHGSTRLGALHAFFTTRTSTGYGGYQATDHNFPLENHSQHPFRYQRHIRPRGVMAFPSSIAIVFIGVTAYAVTAGPVQVKYTFHLFVFF